MQMDLLNLRRICLIFEGVEADEPAMVSEQSQASHSKVTKVSRDDRACAFPTIQIRVARNSKP